MSKKNLYPHVRMRIMAGLLVEALEPFCERIAIAGSIRRGERQCADVELVVIPEKPEALFATIDEWLEKGICQKRINKAGNVIAWGQKMRCLLIWSSLYEFWVPVDLFITTPEQWGVTLAIRTGDKEFSRLLVTQQVKGGACPDHLQFKDWRIIHRETGQATVTEEEIDVFCRLGLPWLPPYKRDGDRLLYWSGTPLVDLMAADPQTWEAQPAPVREVLKNWQALSTWLGDAWPQLAPPSEDIYVCHFYPDQRPKYLPMGMVRVKREARYALEDQAVQQALDEGKHDE